MPSWSAKALYRACASPGWPPEQSGPAAALDSGLLGSVCLVRAPRRRRQRPAGPGPSGAVPGRRRRLPCWCWSMHNAKSGSPQGRRPCLTLRRKATRATRAKKASGGARATAPTTRPHHLYPPIHRCLQRYIDNVGLPVLGRPTCRQEEWSGTLAATSKFLTGLRDVRHPGRRRAPEIW